MPESRGRRRPSQRRRGTPPVKGSACRRAVKDEPQARVVPILDSSVAVEQALLFLAVCGTDDRNDGPAAVDRLLVWGLLLELAIVRP
jgi:hypothetical protein